MNRIEEHVFQCIPGNSFQATCLHIRRWFDIQRAAVAHFLVFARSIAPATNTPVHLQSRQDGTLFDDSGTAFVERDSP